MGGAKNWTMTGAKRVAPGTSQARHRSRLKNVKIKQGTTHR